MQLYACCSASHHRLLREHFLPSLPAPWSDGRGLIVREVQQKNEAGKYGTLGFISTCRDKVDLILSALELEDRPFVFSDVDVRFYGSIVDDLLLVLGDADIAFQQDGPGAESWCCGFMVIRPSERMMGFWLRVRAEMDRARVDDQQAAQRLLRLSDADLKVVAMPSRYWTVGRDSAKVWIPGVPVRPPSDLLVHHANWTIGVQNKIELLNAVMDARRMQAP